MGSANMLRKSFVIFLAFLFMISLAFAQPIYKQSEDKQLNVPCTYNGAICSISATCVGTIINPNGTLIFNQQNMVRTNATYGLFIPANLSQEVGEYQFPVTCCEGVKCSTQNLIFFVTPSGNIATSGEATVYIFLIFVVLFFFLLCLIGAINVNSEHEYDIGGKLLKLKYGAYLKMGLFWLSSIFLWILLYLGWEISNKVLMFAFIGEFFHTAFLIMTYLLAPVFIAFVILALVKWTADLELHNLTKRGLRPR